MKNMTALIIMDGFGERAETQGNAIKLAGTPNIDKLKAEYPHTVIGASGMDVGLPDGQMGNSEVGHLNIGAGRIVFQELSRINNAIKDGSTTVDANTGGGANPSAWTNWAYSKAGHNTAEITFEYATEQQLGQIVMYFFRDSNAVRFPRRRQDEDPDLRGRQELDGSRCHGDHRGPGVVRPSQAVHL